MASNDSTTYTISSRDDLRIAATEYIVEEADDAQVQKSFCGMFVHRFAGDWSDRRQRQ
jgi:hypothetical protein